MERQINSNRVLWFPLFHIFNISYVYFLRWGWFPNSLEKTLEKGVQWFLTEKVFFFFLYQLREPFENMNEFLGHSIDLYMQWLIPKTCNSSESWISIKRHNSWKGCLHAVPRDTSNGNLSPKGDNWICGGTHSYSVIYHRSHVNLPP
jgi:hypothetical protein